MKRSIKRHFKRIGYKLMDEYKKSDNKIKFLNKIKRLVKRK
jgi:hypothetical protein